MQNANIQFLVQLAFRSAQALLMQKKEQVKQIFFNPSPSSSAQSELETAIMIFLRRTVDTFDITPCIEVRLHSMTQFQCRMILNPFFPLSKQEVSTQLWATLYDYPCLKNCTGLLQYIKDSVRLAWALSNQVNVPIIPFPFRVQSATVLNLSHFFFGFFRHHPSCWSTSREYSAGMSTSDFTPPRMKANKYERICGRPCQRVRRELVFIKLSCSPNY